jgi:hypothetical protein
LLPSLPSCVSRQCTWTPPHPSTNRVPMPKSPICKQTLHFPLK